MKRTAFVMLILAVSVNIFAPGVFATSASASPSSPASSLASAQSTATPTPIATKATIATPRPTATATPVPRPTATAAPTPGTSAEGARPDAESMQAAYSEAVNSLKCSLTDSDALTQAYRTFDSMKGFLDSDGYALLTQALIAVSLDSFDGAQVPLETLRQSGFENVLEGTGIPTPGALIAYCEGRVFERSMQYYEAYQAYVSSGALDSLTRASAIRSEQAESLYMEAADLERDGDFTRSAEIFGVLGGYLDSRERQAEILDKISDDPKTEETTSETMYVVNCTSYVSLREWPSNSAPALDMIARLDTVEFLDVYDGSYYHVRYRGVEGYVLAYYLSRDPDYVAPPTPAPVVPRSIGKEYPLNTTLTVVNCDKNITLRAQPSSGAAKVIKIPKGDVVTYLDSMDNGFYKVIYHGHTGYARSEYLAINGCVYMDTYERGELLVVVNCDDHISMRKKPDPQATRVKTIGLGEVVTYISSAKNGYCKVKYGGKTGYVLVSYLSR